MPPLMIPTTIEVQSQSAARSYTAERYTFGRYTFDRYLVLTGLPIVARITGAVAHRELYTAPAIEAAVPRAVTYAAVVTNEGGSTLTGTETVANAVTFSGPLS
jgi:hypothetical protein